MIRFPKTIRSRCTWSTTPPGPPSSNYTVPQRFDGMAIHPRALSVEDYNDELKSRVGKSAASYCTTLAEIVPLLACPCCLSLSLLLSFSTKKINALFFVPDLIV